MYHVIGADGKKLGPFQRWEALKLTESLKGAQILPVGAEYVHDARNGNVTGPFDAGDGEKMASMLNRQVAENTLGVLAMLATEIRGPFYVHSDKRKRY